MIKGVGGDPDQNSLRLLPSGPDRIGERSAHCRTPTCSITAFALRHSRARSISRDLRPNPTYAYLILMTSANFYADVPLNRDDRLRGDELGLSRLRQDPSCKVLILWRDKHQVLGHDHPIPVWHSGRVAQDLLADNTNWILLGVRNRIAHFAVDISHFEDPSDYSLATHKGQFMDLRTLGPLLSRGDSATMAYARSMTYWNRRNLFCGKCGHSTKHAEGGHVRKCTNPDCGIDHFPRTDPAIIVLVVHENDCLLGRQKVWRKGMRSTLAGFLEPGESLEETVIRELHEEAGVKLAEPPVYQHSQPWPFPSSLMVGFYARAENKALNVNTDELESVDWFSRDLLLNSPENDVLRLPRQDSIARRLIDDWLSDKTTL